MMKKLGLTCIVLGLIAGSGYSHGVPYSSPEGAYPVQLSLFPPAQLVHHTKDVAGIRLGLISVNRDVAALDIGLVNWSTGPWRGAGLGLANVVRDDAYGVKIGLVNYAEGDMTGFQGVPFLTFWNAFNIVGGHTAGMQGGLFNQSQAMRGVQGGLINIGYDAAGVQLGLYNYSIDYRGVQLGIVNVGYESAHGVQFGLFNQTSHFTGLQLGILNRTRTLDGMQIGLINVVADKPSMPILPIVNWSF